MGHLRLRAEDGYVQRVGHMEVIFVGNASHNEGLAAPDQILDPLHRTWTVLEMG